VNRRSSRTVTVLRWVLLIVLPGAAAGLSALAVAATGQVRVSLVIGAVSCVIALAFVQVYGEIQGWRLGRSGSAARIVLAESVILSGRPLITLMGRIANACSEEERRAHVSTLISRAVGIAQSQCGRLTEVRCATRATLYEFLSDGRLVRRQTEGRQGRMPRIDFVSSRSENDRGVIEIAKGENSLLITDVDKAPPRHFADYPGREYKSFLMVPLRADGRSFGFLGVDSDRTNTITETDVGFATLIAGIMAAALASVARSEKIGSDRAESTSSIEPPDAEDGSNHVHKLR
jgi:hypothetical protein